MGPDGNNFFKLLCQLFKMELPIRSQLSATVALSTFKLIPKAKWLTRIPKRVTFKKLVSLSTCFIITLSHLLPDLIR